MTGPQQERLRQNVDGADHGQVTSAGFDWKAKGDLLDIVASQLEFNAAAPREAMGGQTGVATSEAFARSGKAMAAKSAELQHGGEILMKSGQAIKNAEDEHRSLGAQPGAPTEPTYDSGSPQTKAELRQHSEHQAAAAAWQAEYDRRERRAEKANLELEQALRGYSNDMAKIHGENMDKPSSVQGGSGSVAAPGGGGTAYGGGGGGHAGGGGRGDQPHAQGEIIEFVPHHPTHDTPPTTTGTPPSGGDVGAGTGTGTSTSPAASAQGGSSSPVLGQTTVPGGAGGSVSASSATGSAIGAGGLAVAAGGGLMAAGSSPASAIRGGLVASPTAATAGGSSARSIGAGSARGAAPTLGRSGSVVAGGSPAGSSSARSAGGGATGRSGTSRPTVAGHAGSQAGGRATGRAGGASGSGRSATGAAAQGAGRGGKDKRRNGQVVDHLLEEWELDEEDLGPAVID